MTSLFKNGALAVAALSLTVGGIVGAQDESDAPIQHFINKNQTIYNKSKIIERFVFPVVCWFAWHVIIDFS